MCGKQELKRQQVPLRTLRLRAAFHDIPIIDEMSVSNLIQDLAALMRVVESDDECGHAGRRQSLAGRTQAVELYQFRFTEQRRRGRYS